MVPPGIEPGTQGFSVLCSTNWAMAPHEAHVSFAIAKVGSFSETTKFLPCFLVCFALFGSHFILLHDFVTKKPCKVTPMGFKPMTFRTGIWRSIQLSYGALFPAKIQLSFDLTKRFFYFIPLPYTAFALSHLRLQHFTTFLPFAPNFSQKISNVFRKNSHVFQKISKRFSENSPTFFAKHRR